MTIRLKLLLSIALVIILSLIISGIILFSARRVGNAVATGQKSDRIVREIFQLTLLLNDYLMYFEERSAKQWQIKHKTIGMLLASQRYNDPKDQAIHENIIKTHTSVDRPVHDTPKCEDQNQGLHVLDQGCKHRCLAPLSNHSLRFPFCEMMTSFSTFVR